MILVYQSMARVLQNSMGSPGRLAMRSLATNPRKRFYKKVSVVQCNGKYEINLDQRKLKTPGGHIFQVDSEPLALAVANEWSSQADKILLSQMHVNGLCNTCIDNPGHVDKPGLINAILGFLATDTVLYYSDEPPPLLELQMEKWSPVINWFNQRYGVSLEPTLGLSPPGVSDSDQLTLYKHLQSYNMNSLQGLSFGVDALKSIILSLAVVDRRLTVRDAVSLARLELEFQTDHWGSVEWAHDLELHDTTARLAAANLFVHCHSTISSSKHKNIQA